MTEFLHAMRKLVSACVLVQCLMLTASAASLDFSPNKTKGCAPDAVTLSATGYTAGSRFTWVIGNDTVRGKDTVSYLFSSSGTYDVKLIVKSSSGVITTVSKPKLILMGRSNKDLTLRVSKNYLCDGHGDVIISSLEKGIKQFDWIADGTDYTNGGDSVKHFFNTVGYKTISLRTLDSAGCYSVKSIDSMVFVPEPPVLDFSADRTAGCAPAQIQLINTSVSKTRDFATFSWKISGSDDSLQSLSTPKKVGYAKAGKYGVTFSVITKDGCSYQLTKPDYITISKADTPGLSLSKKKACPNEPFTMTTTSPDSSGSTFSWDVQGAIEDSSSKGVAFSKSLKFSSGGIYTLTATQTRGACTVSSNPVVIDITRIKANFSADPLCNCSVPETVNFKASCDTPGTGVNSYQWTLFDSAGTSVMTTANGASLSNTYSKFGDYTVKMSVTNSGGCTDTLTQPKLIKLEPLDTAKMVLDKLFGCIDQKIKFQPPFLTHCNKLKFRYEWTMYAKDKKTVLATFKTPNPKLSYHDTGKYDVALYVSNDAGCVAYKRFIELVHIVIPVAGMAADTTYACMGTGIKLISKMDPPQVPYIHKWKLDLVSDTSVHIYGSGPEFRPAISIPGIYSVTYSANVDTFCAYTIYKNAYLHFSGANGAVAALDTSGCPIFKTQLNSSILQNIHYGTTSDSVKYKWSISPATGVLIANDSASYSDVIISRKGNYTISLTLTNSTGCSHTVVRSNYINIGVTAGINTPSLICYGEKIVGTNSSSSNAVSYQWSADKSVNFSPSALVKEPIISFADSGLHYLNLAVKSDNGCVDSITKPITVHRTDADFSSPKPRSSCAPAFISFQVNSVGADSFFWDFGDGEKLVTTNPNIAHIYKKNSGDTTQGFDVRLIARSNNGCSDTIIKRKYVQIIGPVPAFSFSNSRGCGALKVQFVDKSQFTSSLFYDLNSNGDVQNGKVSSYIYNVNIPGAAYQVFHPRILAKDKYGCSAFGYAKDSIVVYRPSVAGFKWTTASKCAPYTVQFTDTSKYAKSWYWDFNNDGKIDDSTRNPKVVLPVGSYSFKLKVKNALGCTDSMVMNKALTVDPVPSLSISYQKDTFCSNEDISFITKTNHPELITRYEWFVDSKKQDTALLNKSAINIKIAEPGAHLITARLITRSGCIQTKSADRSLVIADTSREVQSQIKYVSVEDDSSVRIEWKQSSNAFFRSYHLMRLGSPSSTEVLNSRRRSNTKYADSASLKVNQYSYGYNMLTEDMCGKLSRASAVHRTILLKVNKEGYNALRLNWSAYKGWTGVREYIISRSVKKSPFAEIAHVQDTSYLNEGLCDEDYRYRVEAVHPQDSFRSRSNAALGHPTYLYQRSPFKLAYASVTDGQKVEVTWEPSTQINMRTYIIDKYDPERGWMKFHDTTTGQYYNDNQANTSKYSYTYRVRVLDQCNYLSVYTNIGKTILLKAAMGKDDNIHLSWNKYEDWSSGIHHYDLEIYDQNDAWTLLATIPGTDTSYVDEKLKENIFGKYKYRVTAVENAPNGYTSVSNVTYGWLPSRVFAPNSFTPNNDGLNDVFKPKAAFVYDEAIRSPEDYTFRVFNRWGEMIFSTHKLSEGWDGTFRGQAAQMDTYIYDISARGIDGEDHFLKGDVYLLK